MKVDFATFVYWKDVQKLHALDVLKNKVNEHGYPFHQIHLVHQNCIDNQIRPITEITVNIIKTENNPNILSEFRIPADDPDAAKWTHAPNHPHWWKNHVINHLNVLKESVADYIVFTDSDVSIIANGPPSWIEYGINCLRKYQNVLIISPDDGGPECHKRVPEGRMVQTVSQQIFLCERARLSAIDFHVPFEASALEEDPKKRKSNKLAPYGPFQEFYFMLEGRMWRYMDKFGLYRLMLKNPPYRYWHGPR